MAKILKIVDFDAHNIVSVKPTLMGLDLPETVEPDDSEADIIENQPEEKDGAEASTLMAEAQAHVEAMLNQAEVKIENWKEAAQKEGWEAGYIQAKQAAEAVLEFLKDKLPAPLAGQLDGLLENPGMADQAAGLLGGLFGKK